MTVHKLWRLKYIALIAVNCPITVLSLLGTPTMPFNMFPSFCLGSTCTTTSLTRSFNLLLKYFLLSTYSSFNTDVHISHNAESLCFASVCKSTALLYLQWQCVCN